jgi:hypothetical protein
MCFASVYGAVFVVHCGTVSGKVCYVRRADTPGCVLDNQIFSCARLTTLNVIVTIFYAVCCSKLLV